MTSLPPLLHGCLQGEAPFIFHGLPPPSDSPPEKSGDGSPVGSALPIPSAMHGRGKTAAAKAAAGLPCSLASQTCMRHVMHCNCLDGLHNVSKHETFLQQDLFEIYLPCMSLVKRHAAETEKHRKTHFASHAMLTDWNSVHFPLPAAAR